jgi:hypothetical protein
MTGFTHPSRPGYYGISFPDAVREWLALAADALVPGDGEYPPASAAQVPRFIEERASPDDLARLADLAQQYPLGSNEAAIAAVTALEQNDAVGFGWLREHVYHGYYASRRVLATMVERGYDYHGAPQPLGYDLPGSTPVPAGRNGSYIRTEEVRRATA